MSLTIQQLLNDAKRLSGRLRDHDASADTIISSTQSVLKDIEAMRQYQEDIDALNSIAHNRPRAQLVLGIQQENRHIRQLQNENKELKAALEDHQNAIELIMSKYRQHVACLLNTTKIDQNLVNQQKTILLQERADKICEMASVMQQSVKIDEENMSKDQELLSRLVTENKGLREMLEISWRNGSFRDPLVGPKMVTRSIQTEPPPSPPLQPVAESLTLASTLSAGEMLNNHSAGQTNGDRPLSSTVNSSTGFCAADNRYSHINHENGRRSVDDHNRPRSSASEESEETSDEDEIIFNTIKRSAKKPPSLATIFDVAADGLVSGSGLNDEEHQQAIPLKNLLNCVSTTTAVVMTSEDHVKSADVTSHCCSDEGSEVKKADSTKDDNEDNDVIVAAAAAVVKVNGDRPHDNNEVPSDDADDEPATTAEVNNQQQQRQQQQPQQSSMEPATVST